MLYRQWVVANCWSEGIGLSATFVIAFFGLQGLEARPGAAAIILGAILAVLLGAALEGGLVGFAQGRVVHRYAPAISVRRWTVATTLGAGAAWLLGMVPSTVIALIRDSAAANTELPAAIEPPALLQYAAAALMGVVLGVVLALPQMLVLRRVVDRPGRWLAANSAAWLLGMPLIFVGMDHLPWGGHDLAIGAGVILVAVVAGAVVGGIHGLWLRRMLPASAPEPPPSG
jgi:hypothetical protein